VNRENGRCAVVEVSHGEALQGRRSRELELGGRPRERQDHQGAHKGYVHHASKDDPQYAIKSDRTEHVALHKAGALTRIRR
jgi:Hypervirulence associated proteins TUDOR domain